MTRLRNRATCPCLGRNRGSRRGEPTIANDDRSSPLASLLTAIRFAADKHRNHRRKDSEASPYINHPIQVAELIARVGGVEDLEVLQAAILHDTIEDTDTTKEELEGLFGAEVADLVAEMTDNKRLPKRVRKLLQIEHAQQLLAKAKLIKLGDKISNVRDVTDCPPAKWTRERRAEYLDWAEKVVAGCRGVNAALEKAFDEAIAKGRARLAE